MKKHKHHPETEAVRGGTDLHKKNGPLTTPIYQTSTFEVTDSEQQVRATSTDMFYTRYGNPTHTVVEEPISRDQLYIADEVFVCGTAAEVVGLREIDFRTIGSGKTGPVTRALQAEFDKLTSGRHPRSAEWLSPVPAFDAALAGV